MTHEDRCSILLRLLVYETGAHDWIVGMMPETKRWIASSELMDAHLGAETFELAQAHWPVLVDQLRDKRKADAERN